MASEMKDKVLKVWPDAKAFYMPGQWSIHDGMEPLSECFATEETAWSDAASGMISPNDVSPKAPIEPASPSEFCPDCGGHAYGDETTPGVFYAKCEKHRHALSPTERAALLADIRLISEIDPTAPPAPERWIPVSGVELIAAERARQIAVEGWAPEHDDTHTSGQMARAAGCYADPVTEFFDPDDIPVRWPWHKW